MDMEKEIKEVEKKDKGRLILPILVGVSIVVAAASLATGVYAMNENAKANRKTARFIDDQLERQAEEEEKLTEYVEDGFMVMDEYEIRSTKQISDAYIANDDSGLSDEDKKTLKLAKDVIAKVIKPEMYNFETELAIYKWLKMNVGQGTSTVVALPDSGGTDFTPGGVLRSHQAVCVGYATTFRMFMQMFGLECHIVHNDSHSWDLVKLDDGEWYHVDIYSDAGSKGYKNFNMTDSACRSGHDWDASSLPEAKGTKYTMAVQRNKQVKNMFAIPKYIKKAIDKKDYSLYFSFKNQPKEEELPVADVLVSQITSAFSYNGIDSYWITGAWIEDPEIGYILCIYIENYSESSNVTVDIPDDKAQRMTDAVNRAFNTQLTYEGAESVEGDAEGKLVDNATTEAMADEDGE